MEINNWVFFPSFVQSTMYFTICFSSIESIEFIIRRKLFGEFCTSGEIFTGDFHLWRRFLSVWPIGCFIKNISNILRWFWIFNLFSLNREFLGYNNISVKFVFFPFYFIHIVHVNILRKLFCHLLIFYQFLHFSKVF